jgi:OOP family OmpA-OmpF porin
MKSENTMAALLFFAALSLSAPTLAAPSDFYVVGSIGRSTLDNSSGSIDTRNLATGFTTSTTSSSSNATSGKIQLGYNLGKSFALEGGYNYLGKVNFVSTTNAAVIGGDKEAHVFNLDLVAKVPLNEQLSMLARVGGYYWKTKSELPNSTTLGTSSVDDTGWDIKFGAGLQYDFNPKWALRGEFERFNGVGNINTSGDSKVNQLTVGAVLKF